jgi:hypothetical protein
MPARDLAEGGARALLRSARQRRRRRVVLPGLPEGASSREAPCLVHLVRASNDPALLRAFAAGLRRHPPGTNCELVLVMKGFRSRAEAEPCLQELADLEPEPLFLADSGRDLGAYFAAAARLRRSRYCFLNSYSVPLVDGWLAKLDAALGQPRTGLVGATGSWFSTRSWISYLLGLPNPYRGLLASPRSTQRQLRATLPEWSPQGSGTTFDSLRARGVSLCVFAEQEGFPAYHLRTNAFMISHATLRRIHAYSAQGRLDALLAGDGKLDALLLECGRNSITCQVRRMGLRTLVVDREGAVFEHERWDRSFTYNQGDQEGLLIADNRTLPYQRADAASRRLFSVLAWGSRARPGPPRNGSDEHLGS